MGTEEQDAIIGKAIREYREAEKELNLLQSKAHDLAHIYSEMGRKLSKFPESVTFEGVSYTGAVVSEPSFKRSDFPEVLVDFVSKYHEATNRIFVLGEKKKRLGI